MKVYNGSSADLAKLVEGLETAEWWPKRDSNPLRFWTSPYPEGGSDWTFSPPGPSVWFERSAASLIFAAAMVWLAESGHLPALSATPNGWSAYIRGPQECGRGPSPLEAVIAAVRSVQ